MIAFLTVIHVMVCIFLVLVVLLQQGKGQDIGSAFGGGGTQTAFGARGGATLLSRLTTVAAALFMLTSITLTIMISRPGVDSVIDENVVTQPATPGVETLPASTVPAADEGAADVEPAAEPDDGTGGLTPAGETEPGN